LTLIKASTAGIVLLMTVIVSWRAGADQNEDSLLQLKTCAQIEDSEQRMACYESLGKQVIAVDRAAESTVETAAEPETAVVPVADTATTAPDVQVAESAATAPAAAEEASTVAETSPTLPDEIGGDRFSQNDAERNRQNRGQVRSCQRDQNNRFTFYFDNGQVWRQTDERRFRQPHDCQFIAEITRDVFGYLMQIEGKKNKIRVKRIL
jgi:hypothetical protein